MTARVTTKQACCLGGSMNATFDNEFSRSHGLEVLGGGGQQQDLSYLAPLLLADELPGGTPRAQPDLSYLAPLLLADELPGGTPRAQPDLSYLAPLLLGG